MKGKGTTEAIFMARQMQENFRVKGKSSVLVLWIWRKGAKRSDKLDNA